MTIERDDFSVVATADDDGERLDVVLGRRAEGLSRRVAKRLALDGKVFFEGRPVPPATRVMQGQRLDVELTSAPSRSAAHRSIEERGASLLRADDARLFVVKPAGVHTHALRPDDPPSLADWVCERFPECGQASEDRREGGATHRLDRDTSGVVCFARSREAWHEARDAFTQGRVHKRYLAVIEAGPWPPQVPEDALPGWLLTEEEPKESPAEELPLELLRGMGVEDAHRATRVRIRAPLGRADDRARVAVRLDGQRAVTVAVSLAVRGQARLVDLSLETGHRHQIRAHASWIGAPLLGDRQYGGPAAPRLMLHAAILAFDDDPPGAAVVCPPPADFWPPTT